MRILTENGFIEAVALFFELTDELLDRVKTDRKYYLNEELVKECMRSKGDNAHFYALCSDKEKNIIFKYLSELRKQYKTISWWDRDMDEFKLTRS